MRESLQREVEENIHKAKILKEAMKESSDMDAELLISEEEEYNRTKAGSISHDNLSSTSLHRQQQANEAQRGRGVGKLNSDAAPETTAIAAEKRSRLDRIFGRKPSMASSQTTSRTVHSRQSPQTFPTPSTDADRQERSSLTPHGNGSSAGVGSNSSAMDLSELKYLPVSEDDEDEVVESTMDRSVKVEQLHPEADPGKEVKLHPTRARTFALPKSLRNLKRRIASLRAKGTDLDAEKREKEERERRRAAGSGGSATEEKTKFTLIRLLPWKSSKRTAAIEVVVPVSSQHMAPTTLRPSNKGAAGGVRKKASPGNQQHEHAGLSTLGPTTFTTGAVSPFTSGDALSRKTSAALKNMPPGAATLLNSSTSSSIISNAKWSKLNLPVFRYATWLEENQLKRSAPWIATGIALMLRWIVGLGPYSGMNVPPRFGDYEAQRHWMELTLHRPIRQWYSDDSKWWDLDYPPLTAYVSWICGYIPEWFAWKTSRGYESEEAKIYMRSTVLVLELVVYISAVFVFTSRWFANKPWARQHTALILILMQPGLILIDSGHFQYNAVMLGFVVWSINCFLVDQDVLGSIFFCLALGFKQMALYFSPAVFAYLLGKSLRRGFFGCIWKLVKLGSTVILTLGVLFAPWAQTVPEFFQVIHRIFPVFRGLYQDKVGNVWCAVNVVIKLREIFDIQQLVRFSTIATALAFLPSTLQLIFRPTKRSMVYGLANASLSFFLLSFQVHEKSILIPALPITLLILDELAVAALFVTLATFSMYPLLKQESLTLPYFVLMGLWVWLTAGTFKDSSKILSGLATVNLFVIVSMHAAEQWIPTPLAKYPDLYPVLNALWSAAGFILFWIYFNYRQFTLNRTVDTVAGAKSK
ncbi:Glucosyltransferase-like protein [Gryganskiella cystojenkinii]|nr:Glucosyltransferase-like protein [Gryganskiella cystojenkinii]